MAPTRDLGEKKKNTHTIRKLIETRNYWESPFPALEEPSVSDGCDGSLGNSGETKPSLAAKAFPSREPAARLTQICLLWGNNGVESQVAWGQKDKVFGSSQ